MKSSMPEEITLPRELANGTLSLEEIGTIFVLMCIPDGYYDKWQDREEFISNCISLRDEGIVVLNDKNEIEIDIDLTWI